MNLNFNDLEISELVSLIDEKVCAYSERSLSIDRKIYYLKRRLNDKPMDSYAENDLEWYSILSKGCDDEISFLQALRKKLLRNKEN